MYSCYTRVDSLTNRLDEPFVFIVCHSVTEMNRTLSNVPAVKKRREKGIVTCPRRPFSFCHWAPEAETVAVVATPSCCFHGGGAVAKCWTVANCNRWGETSTKTTLHRCCNSKKKMALIDCRGMPVSRRDRFQWKCHVAAGRHRFAGRRRGQLRRIARRVDCRFIVVNKQAVIAYRVRLPHCISNKRNQLSLY